MMRLRQVNPEVIVLAKITAVQAGLDTLTSQQRADFISHQPITELQDKTVIITGGSSGIGRAAALDIAAAAEVHDGAEARDHVGRRRLHPFAAWPRRSWDA